MLSRELATESDELCFNRDFISQTQGTMVGQRSRSPGTLLGRPPLLMSCSPPSLLLRWLAHKSPRPGTCLWWLEKCTHRNIANQII